MRPRRERCWRAPPPAGNPRGATSLAALSGGAGGPVADPAGERALLAKAADANSAEAQFQLGLMYAEGTGGPQDDVAARALFEKAAAQNHAGALDWLGSFTQNGRGGPKDETAAKGITNAPRRLATTTPRRRCTACNVRSP